MVGYRVSTDNGATRDVVFATALVADEQFPQSVLEKAILSSWFCAGFDSGLGCKLPNIIT
jgi:hypothetical protein